MHDVTWSEDSEEYIDVPVPDDDHYFEPGTTLRVARTKPVDGSGLSKDNPRQILNQATTWLDLSALYGSSEEVANKLRSFQAGRLLTHRAHPKGYRRPADYLPFNTMGVPTRTRPGVDPEALFAGGDPRTNEDWMMLGVHTLLLREHNRLCDLVGEKHPEYDDEQIYQTVRLVMSAKYDMIANSYQMAYWTDEMPWPRDDGFPLYRQMYGEDSMQINPFNSYPWPLVTKGGKPMVVSAEMAVVYRFHEFIISEFPIIDARNRTLWIQDLFKTGFNAKGFVETGLENILRGTVSTTIPNFKSGVDENFRSASRYRGANFDIVTTSIIHEREQGLPTFNQYFRAYNDQDPAVEVPIRHKFEDFSQDPEMVENLKSLYSSPDDVDLVVGVQLDEQYFPGTSVPKSALIVSLFSLFGMGNSDRFSIGYAITRCALVDQPWDCHPSNALEELIWQKVPGHPDLPDFRKPDTFWLQEMDLPANGANLLWRLVTENTEIKCLQRRPLFPADPESNPVLCSLPKDATDPTISDAPMIPEFLRALLHRYPLVARWSRHLAAGAVLLLILAVTAAYQWHQYEKMKHPPIMTGGFLLGRAKTFSTNPLKVLREGIKEFPNRAFGIQLMNQQHFVIQDPRDMALLKQDNPYEIRFSLHAFMRSINFPLITKEINFDQDLHTNMVKANLTNSKKVGAYHQVLEDASYEFISRNPLTNDGRPTKHDEINDYLMNYITFVFSRFIVGPSGFDNPELLETFKKFNEDANKAIMYAGILPGFLKRLGAWNINDDFGKIWRHLRTPIKSRRAAFEARGRVLDHTKPPVLMDEMIREVDDDHRVSDLVALLVFGGLANLQSTFLSTVLDIINEPGLQERLLDSLYAATSTNLDAFHATREWSALRSACFESVRLAGPVTGPARMMMQDTPLPSNPAITLPKDKIATLTAHFTHRDPAHWGPDAASYRPDRFLPHDPPVGDSKFITWGLKGPHLCPGRWIALSAMQIMTKALLERYVFRQHAVLADAEKFYYPDAGSVMRHAVPVTVSLRDASRGPSTPTKRA